MHKLQYTVCYRHASELFSTHMYSVNLKCSAVEVVLPQIVVVYLEITEEN